MNLTNAYERYYIIFSLLCCQDYTVTISNLSRHLTLTIGSIRRDFAELLTAPSLRHYILSSSTTEQGALFTDSPDYFYENLSELDRHSLRTDILNGRYDLTIFALDAYEIGFNADTLLLPIHSIEYLALKDIAPEMLTHHIETADIYQKPAISDISERQKHWTEEIEKAIMSNMGLKIRRQTHEGPMEFKIMPQRIFRDTYENTVYCIDTAGLSHPLDTIRSMTVIPPFPVKKADDMTDFLWGISYHDTEKVEDVTLLIQNCTANILAKIQADTARRRFGRLELCPDGTCIYTDKIIGMDAFRRWLRSYGSAIVVLKPLKLAKEMYDSARRMYENYTHSDIR